MIKKIVFQRPLIPLLTLLGILGLLALSGCKTTPEPIPEDPGYLTHDPSGVIIPRTVGPWEFTKKTQYGENGMDTGYTFHYRKETPAWATLYIYPAGMGLSSEAFAEHYEECLGAIYKLYPRHEIITIDEEPVMDGTEPEANAVIRYTSNGVTFVTTLYLRLTKGWYQKYRITVEEEFYESCKEDVQLMISERNPPIIPLDTDDFRPAD